MTHPILPKGVNAAIKMIIDIAEELTEIMEQEARALMLKDQMGFMNAQGEKTRLTNNYEQACVEFKERAEDFKAADAMLVKKLEQAQANLLKQTNDNNEVMERLQERTGGGK